MSHITPALSPSFDADSACYYPFRTLSVCVTGVPQALCDFHSIPSINRLVLSLSIWRLHCTFALQIPERRQINMGRPPASSVRCGGLHSHRKTLCTGFLDLSVCHYHLFCSRRKTTGKTHGIPR